MLYLRSYSHPYPYHNREEKPDLHSSSEGLVEPHRIFGI